MKKVLLFGGSGNAGRAIANELAKRNYDLTAVVRSSKKAEQLAGSTLRTIIADIGDPRSLQGACRGSDVFVSALGKSVSLNDRSSASFRDVDLALNLHILRMARDCGAGKFVYLSALHADRHPQLAYFKAHADFEEALKDSGLDYSIIRPPAIFSSFIDLMQMARKGRLMNVGRGDKRTNPIYEGDLAKVVCDSIDSRNAVIEAGGKEILTRKQINEIIRDGIGPDKRMRKVPIGLISSVLPLLRPFDRNTYDKLSFYLAVMQEDAVAPQVGELTLEEYVRMKRKDFVR